MLFHIQHQWNRIKTINLDGTCEQPTSVIREIRRKNKMKAWAAGKFSIQFVRIECKWDLSSNNYHLLNFFSLNIKWTNGATRSIRCVFGAMGVLVRTVRSTRFAINQNKLTTRNANGSLIDQVAASDWQFRANGTAFARISRLIWFNKLSFLLRSSANSINAILYLCAQAATKHMEVMVF